MTELVPWTADDFADAFQRHLPTGAVWPRGPDTTQRAAIRALMPTYERSWALACDLPVETLPATAVALLPEWELSLGLPDPCAGPDPTIAQRQAHVVARLTQSNGPSIPSLTAFAAALLPNASQPLLADDGTPLLADDGTPLLADGEYGITIREFRPSIAGRMRAGDPVASAAWAHAWQVVTPATITSYFRAGSNRAGERLTTWGNNVLECEMERLKPAHTVLGFAYSGTPATAALGSFILGRDILAS